jgi:SAM-dependent methyltransferase
MQIQSETHQNSALAANDASRRQGARVPRIVLEIGGGHNPYPQSDVIVDKYLENKERGGDLKRDRRPIVIADFQHLPFRSGTFAYAFCSHVIEHVEEPATALAELARVAAAGYLEAPSIPNEIVEPHREYHRWYVARSGAKLLFYPKTSQGGSMVRQSLLKRLTIENLAFRLFFLSNTDLAFTRLEWRDRVDHEIFGNDVPLELDRLYPRVRQSALGMIRGLAALATRKLRRKAMDGIRRFRAPVDIEPYLCCPACKSPLGANGDRLTCGPCGGYYRKQGNLYRLLREDIVML